MNQYLEEKKMRDDLIPPSAKELKQARISLRLFTPSSLGAESHSASNEAARLNFPVPRRNQSGKVFPLAPVQEVQPRGVPPGASRPS